ncbi:hypothetical protein EB796_012103 [Bugula neritina]|uniref:Uncharacterized protein n=1 Tax=Bugula neritina TaxID=10212 RepID=A0A7J7JV60_BUGNE|nr:hypothetical protein EB796_012103 [Bugula neritina]
MIILIKYGGPWLLDLCDEHGNLKSLPDKSLIENLSSMFEHRGIYIPILVAKTTDGHYKNLIPLVEDVSAEMDSK